MPPEPIRVLVVDDSAFVRSSIVRILEAEPAIRVVGTASNGLIALDAVARLSPDVVTLDIEMPGMDGKEFLKRIRTTHPRLPIIMFSHLTTRGAMDTLDAILFGATDYVSKPNATGGPEAAREQIRTQLIPKILAFHESRPSEARAEPDGPRSAEQARTPRGANPARGPQARPAPSPQKARAPEIVVIGSSTGGPVALDEIVRALPRDFPIPIAVVQHMPATFTRLLSERIASRARISVAEASHGEPLVAGRLLLAPGSRHLSLRRDGIRVVVELTDELPVAGRRPAIDPLFRSAAKCYGSAAVAVVLTGMGSDGVEGSRAIVEAGGRVLVQDAATSVMWGLPGQVAKAGLAHAVLGLRELAAEIQALVGAKPRSEKT